jgi:UDP-N-acetylmuramoyl-tripeptide--D-alanyl-D-alanine ligase
MFAARDFFTLNEAADIIGGSAFPASRGGELLSQGFKTDNRNVDSGDVFIAIKGARVDGHDYITSAADDGASCVMLDRSYFEAHREKLEGCGVMLLVSENASEGAAILARAWLDAVSPKVIGITGSVGKTTTREFIYAVLKRHFRTHSAIKSYNTLIGSSMTILAMPRDTEILILELGANHSGEIKTLVERFPVTHGVITEVTHAHIEGFGSIEGVLEAKMEMAESGILEYLSYNSDNDMLTSAVSRMPNGEKVKKGGIKQVGVGYSNFGVRISDVRQSVDSSFVPALSVALSRGERKLSCSSPVFGRQHAKNIAFAYAVSVQMGLDDDVFLREASSFELPAGRGSLRRAKNDCLVIDETYNANPSSVSHAIKNILELETPGDYRRIAILGGMRELGTEAAHWHDVILNRASLLDEIYLIGAEWGGANAAIASLRGVWESASQMTRDFDFSSLSRSVILVKGSRFYELEAIMPCFDGERYED